jgi:hypothetical protein
MNAQTRYSFGFDLFTPHIPVWNKLVGDLRDKEISVLEIGAFEGSSSTWIVDSLLSHPKSRLVSVDPFLMGSEARYMRNLEATARREQVCVVKDRSRNALVALAADAQGKKFDLIYIDGDHTASSVLEDAVLAFALLAQGGVMIFDDYGMDDVKRAVDGFLACHEKDVIVLSRAWQLAVKKVNGGVNDENVLSILRGRSDVTSVLDLSGNQIGPSGLKAISHCFPHLTALNLAWNLIGPDGAVEIARGLQSLTSLNLAGNQIMAEGTAAIATGLQHLVTLELDANQIGHAGAETIARHLTELQSVSLGFNQISDAGIHAFLVHARGLRSLDLTCNEITADGAEALARVSLQLRSLDLTANQIGPLGARAISLGLRGLGTLKLNWSGLGDPGTAELSGGLREIRSLELCYNAIGDDGVAALTSLETLQRLDLKFNRITDVGAIALLRQSPALEFLDLTGNNLTEDTAAVVREIRQSRSTLTVKY